MDETKVCRACGRRLPLSAYGRYARSSDGHMPMCRECVNRAQRERRRCRAVGTPAPRRPEVVASSRWLEVQGRRARMLIEAGERRSRDLGWEA